MENEEKIIAADLLLECADYIDIKNVSQRIENMSKAYIDFVIKELEDKNAPPNTELPLILSMAMSLTNVIASTIGHSGAKEDFFNSVKDSIVEQISTDMDTHYNLGIKNKNE